MRPLASRITLAAFLLADPSLASLVRAGGEAVPVQVVPVFNIPGFSVQDLGAAPAAPSGTLDIPSLDAARAQGLPASSLEPAGAASSAETARGASRKAGSRLVWAARLDARTRLVVSEAGEVALEVASVGDRVFDMRRDQIAAQWPSVAAAVEAALARPGSGPGLAESVRRDLRRIAVERSVRPAPGTPVRGDVRLDPEIGAPIKGVEELLKLAASQASEPSRLKELFGQLFDGYHRAMLTLAGLPSRGKAGPIVNDVTQINPIRVARIETPRTTEELAALVKDHPGPVAVGGGRFSMGGQTATEDALHLDLRKFDKVLEFSPDKKEITVQTGIRWRDIQEFVDPHDLSLKIMQSYANFTVGGSLSVNSHGRYMGLGPLILSVKSIKVVLADGRVEKASPTENPELFYGAIGGYGGLGVIAEATLDLTDNTAVERVSESMPVSKYKEHFLTRIRNSGAAVFHNADLTPPYDKVRAVTFYETDKPVTVKDRLVPKDKDYWLNRLIIYLITERPWGKLYRRLADRLTYMKRPVVWRNHEASFDVAELEPRSREKSTYVLQEYFVPVERFDEFAPKLAEILQRHKVNALNVSVRHARKDPGSLLAWAGQEVFAFVLYYKQGVQDFEKAEVAVWTRELVDAAVATGGTYYLPYQIHATDEQFRAAYPRADEYFALKAKLDPTNKFRNKLWDAYYPPNRKPEAPRDEGWSSFKTVFLQTKWRDDFYRFLQLIYHLYPENSFHHLLWDEVKKGGADEAIYKRVQSRLGEVRPFLGPLRYALPSLSKQRAEMADQTKAILGPQEKPIRGYVEIGTTGRYVGALKERLPIKGPVYVINDKAPGYSPEDVFERGRLRKVGTFIGDLYEPIRRDQIPDASVDLVTVYIGLHHCPPKKYDAWVRSIWRILRPGGRLVVRDHDVDSPDMEAFVHLAHDVYNAGLGVPWDENKREIRFLTSVPQLEAELGKRGFGSTGKRILQHKDPTLNTLVEFVKTDLPGEPAELGRHHRAPELTHLTIPEWNIVYASREYARHLESKRPSAFPYVRIVGQYWSEYRQAVRSTKEQYGFNAGAHLMLAVIGVSHTVEFWGKGLYENTVGRLTEWLSRGGRTPEDAYARKVAQEYAAFINLVPWYEFPYFKRLSGLWKETPLFGRDMLRKLERKAILSLEYAVKGAYAWLIKKAAGSVYEPEVHATLVVTGNVPDSVLQRDKRIKVLAQLDADTQAVLLPRYGPFTDAALLLAREGLTFKRIAGNDGEIMVTALAPRAWTNSGAGAVRYEYGLLTEPGLKRVAIAVPVAQLAGKLLELERDGAAVEHVYDF